MEDARSGRVIELKRQIALFVQDETRLLWLIHSPLSTSSFKVQATLDLDTLTRSLRDLRAELGRVEEL